MTSKLTLLTLHRYVFFSFIIFLSVEFLKYTGLSVPSFFTNYLNDFIVIPLVAFLCLRTVWFIKKDKLLRLSGFNLTSLVAMYSWYFEYYLPEYESRYTGDVWDIVCYASGGVLFYWLQKAP